jgi:adenine phosphoribosyltransferase
MLTPPEERVIVDWMAEQDKRSLLKTDPRRRSVALRLRGKTEAWISEPCAAPIPWCHGELYQKIIKGLAEPFRPLGVTKVVGLESRGFVLGGAVAFVLGAGFVPARKGGRMYKHAYSPDEVLHEDVVDYSGTSKSLELESNGAIVAGDRALVIDDWFFSGAQGLAAIRLIERAGGRVVGVGVMIDNLSQDAREKFAPYNLCSVLRVNVAARAPVNP